MGKPWTKKEVEILKEKLPEMGLAGFMAAGLLDRSENAIVLKAGRLGLKLRCVDCGAEISPTSVRCRSCAAKVVWACAGEEMRWERCEGLRAATARGHHYSKEARRKLSEAAKARWADGVYDDLFDEECRRKLSESLKAAWARGDFDDRVLNFVFSEETRHKMSVAAKARWASGEFDDRVFSKEVR